MLLRIVSSSFLSCVRTDMKPAFLILEPTSDHKNLISVFLYVKMILLIVETEGHQRL